MDLVRGVLGERKQLYLVFTALYKIQLKNNVIFVAKKKSIVTRKKASTRRKILSGEMHRN